MRVAPIMRRIASGLCGGTKGGMMKTEDWIVTLIIGMVIAFLLGFWAGHGSMRKLLQNEGYAVVAYPLVDSGEGHWVVYNLESCGEVE